MTKRSSSLQRFILKAVLCFFALLKPIKTRNSYDNFDLSTQTLNPVATGFKITGSAASDQLGFWVSAAGDINNDGYDDIIVGAMGKSAAYVIYGGEESSFLDIDLSSTSLNPQTTGFMIKGGTSDYLGYSVSTAGDINKDGYDDIIVGAPGWNGYRGAAYVIYGGEKSSMINWDFSSGATLNPASTGFMMTGIVPGTFVGDYFGQTVSTVGDVNNDGYDDIVVGSGPKNSYQGVVYVIYGGEKSSMSNWAFGSGATLTPSTTGFTITGSASGDYFGFSVSTAGDINNDGYDDIIAGAFQRGTAYVIYGRPKSSMSNIIVSSSTLIPASTGFTITGNGGKFGWSVSTAGDINKDGYDDIIIGTNGINTAYVIYGGEKSTMSNFALGSTPLNPPTTGFMITGAGDYSGYSVSTAGDVNKDGYDDILVGAYARSSYRGGAYIIYGRPKSSMSNIVLGSTPLDPTSTGFLITGNVAGDYFGDKVSRAGDINNDGYDDIIVGAVQKSSNKGAVYVIYASCSKNCKQCSSESVCTECKTPYLLYNSECFASCPEATVKTSPTLCSDCPLHCKQCSSTSVCDECKDSYILYLSGCLDSCPNGMFLSTTNTCEFCQSPCRECTSLSECTECISPLNLYESQCLKSCPITMFHSNNICKSCPSYCSSCTSQTSCQVCFEGYTLSDSLCVFPSASNSSSSSSQQGAQEKASQVIASATQGIGSVICVGSAVFPFSALVSKIVQNTRYLNLSVTSELSEVYKTWRTELISWDVPNLMSDLDHFETSPILFAQYDLGSPFLANFWPTLINVVIGFGTFIACILLQKLFEHANYEGWAYSLLLKLVAGSFNFALVQAYACLDDILFYLVLDAKTNHFNSFFSWSSMICAVLFLALGCLQVFFNFWTVVKYQNIKNQGTKDLIEAFNERNKYWELFYSDFSDDDIWTQSFFAIAIIRSTLSSLIITVLYDYPLMQTSYLVMMDLAIISFLFFKNPFKTLRGKLAQYYYEIITLLVHLFAFIMSLQDTFKSSSETVRLIMSTGILYFNTALVSGAIGFMFIEIYETIRRKTRKATRKQYGTIAIQTGDHLETQNLTLTTSPGRQTRVQRKQGNRMQTEEISSLENSRFLSVLSNNNTIISEFNMETQELDQKAENSFVSGRHARNKIARRGDLLPTPILNRPLARRGKQSQQKKMTTRPNNGIYPHVS